MGPSWIAPLVVSLWLGGTDPATAQAVAQRVLQDGRYQQALESRRRWRAFDGDATTSAGDDATARTRRGRPGGDDAPAALPTPADPPSGPRGGGGSQGGSGTGSGASFLTAVAVLGGLLVLGVVVASVLQRRSIGPMPRAAAPPAAAPPEPDLVRPLDEAEQLALEGRHAEAVHLLLLRSLRVLAEAHGLPASLTSREIVRDIPMPDAAREALADLVGEVERSLFGGRPVDESAWLRCRDRHATLLQALARPAAGRRA
ncbi:MAG: DUF4129 domain-containing protein [Planctomycetota bacterium]